MRDLAGELYAGDDREEPLDDGGAGDIYIDPIYSPSQNTKTHNENHYSQQR